MANPSSYFHIPHPLNVPARSVEVPSPTGGMPLQNGLRPDVTHAEPYRGVDDNYGHWAQFYDNTSHQDPSPPLAVNLNGQYNYHRNQNIGCSPPGNEQGSLVASGPSHIEYHSPHAHDTPDSGVRDRAPLVPDSTNPFSQSVPSSPPSESLAMESLKRLAERYFHDPGSRIDTLRMGLSPSGNRLRVTIMFDIDV